MRSLFLIAFFSFSSIATFAQNLYFPPLTGNTWDTIAPTQLGWCPTKIDTLLNFLEDENTKAFIVLQDGKIVIEQYFDNFNQNSSWYWASAGKSLTAFLTGLAQEQGYLNINDTTSTYLGQGWTSCTAAEEEKITVLNQLTMTSGLDDGWGGDSDCTDDTCLFYEADAGTRWAYHNAPYTLIEEVVANAVGSTYNQWTNNTIEAQTGMSGIWIKLGYNNVYWSKPRDMARFGLVMLNNGVWDTDTVMHDQSYLNDMIVTSQNLNNSYGYLWWLNSGPDYMVPGLQWVFNGNITANAPNDMYAAMGKNGQLLNVVPSKNLIVVRMGDNPNNSLVPVSFQNDMWEKLNDVMCFTSVSELESNSIHISPNPAQNFTQINSNKNFINSEFRIYDVLGNQLVKGIISSANQKVNIESLPTGVYMLQMDDMNKAIRFLKN
jgi:CubicO group peptidase (beta-lactamase class C family)